MAYKKLLLMAATMFALASEAQVKGVTITKPGGDTTVSGTEQSFKVHYVNASSTTDGTAWFLNGKFINPTIFKTITPDEIEAMDVKKEGIKIEGTSYTSQIHVTTKAGFNPKLVSLTNLKRDYTSLKDKPAVYMIDGQIVNGDYTTYLVDLNRILSVVVDKLVVPSEKIDVALIRVLTKTEENIRKSKQIMIRGAEHTTE